MRELRYIRGLEARSAVAGSDSAGTVYGKAVVYNSLSTVIGDSFRELVVPGAFDESLQANPDVFALFEHDVHRVLGRTRSQTLRLINTPDALSFELDLPNTSDGKDTFVMVTRGDIDGMSFGFDPVDTKWQSNRGADGFPTREIVKAILYEISITLLPFYPASGVQARSMPAGYASPAEIIRQIPHNRTVVNLAARQNRLEALAGMH